MEWNVSGLIHSKHGCRYSVSLMHDPESRSGYGQDIPRVWHDKDANAATIHVLMV